MTSALREPDDFAFVRVSKMEPAFCETIGLNREAGRLPKDLWVFEGDVSALDPNEVLSRIGLSQENLTYSLVAPHAKLSARSAEEPPFKTLAGRCFGSSFALWTR